MLFMMQSSDLCSQKKLAGDQRGNHIAEVCSENDLTLYLIVPYVKALRLRQSVTHGHSWSPEDAMQAFPVEPPQGHHVYNPVD